METHKMLEILACPVCKKNVISKDGLLFCSETSCKYSAGYYQLNNAKFVFVDFENSLLVKDVVLRSGGGSIVSRMKTNVINDNIRKILNGSGRKTCLNLNYIVNCLKDLNFIPRILIIGGGKIGVGIDFLYKNFGEGIVCFDIYNSDNVDFIADAHSLPFQDNTFDLIIVQAVLEHVYNPTIVVEEIYRCLKIDAMVYSETPFLQHVHEGAYDFTRYTVLGHRILFKNFQELESGFIGGVGLTLLWSIEYLFSALFRSRKIGKLSKLVFFWVRYLDFLVPERYNIDSACGAYFIGKKRVDVIEDFLNDYKGAQ
jgi:SAM-dependent methyltransferase